VYVTRVLHYGSLGGTINASLLSRILLGSGGSVFVTASKVSAKMLRCGTPEPVERLSTFQPL
jgi:hypothetical protein